MAIRYLDPECSFDYAGHCQNVNAFLLHTRTLLPKDFYCMNLPAYLYQQLYPLELAWNELTGCFTPEKEMDDFEQAGQQVLGYLDRYDAYAEKNAEGQILSGQDVCGVDFKILTGLAGRGANGDNKAVGDLEFAYTVWSALRPVISAWATLGLMGCSPRSAYEELVCFVYSDDVTRQTHGELLNTQDGAITCFKKSVSAHIAGGPAVPGEYMKAPPLW